MNFHFHIKVLTYVASARVGVSEGSADLNMSIETVVNHLTVTN
jgi:hypothetical protein